MTFLHEPTLVELPFELLIVLRFNYISRKASARKRPVSVNLLWKAARTVLVLLTRALDESLRTAARLAGEGHEAILSPVIEMVPTGAVWPAGVVDGAVATSARAFELLSSTPDWPSPEARRLLPLLLVGERTRQAARDRGFEGPDLIAPDAKALIAQFDAFFCARSRLV
ncbi:MAG: uroporphyrinogen-III synthase, partial [Beijerinckiaceae bacterium]|nr:uroporphyrinogen-III synthase [Beijerinckiaceae bacterium]